MTAAATRRISPEQRRWAEVALAWAACRVDGYLHVDQWRALRVVLDRGEDVELDGGTEPQGVIERVEALRDGLCVVERARLFLTTAWVAIADGRTHGKEVWLLCELRVALRLRPTLARRLYRLAREHRLAPGRRGDVTLATLLAEGGRVAALDAAVAEPA